MEGQKDRGKDGGGCWQLVKGKARGAGVGEGHLLGATADRQSLKSSVRLRAGVPLATSGLSRA